MKWNFPEILTTRNNIRQSQKITDEVNEYNEDPTDEECVDILHAAETLIKLHFKNRDNDLKKTIKNVIDKNVRRGYYFNKVN